MIIVIFVWTLFYFLIQSPLAESHYGLKVVIDHDGGADDAIAITMSLLYEKYFNGPTVVALSTVHGNVNGSQAVINSARILDLCGRSDIPIYEGASQSLISQIKRDYYFGYDGLGDLGYTHPTPVSVQNVPAAVGLIELSKKYAGELVIIAIGPVTNIALAMRLDPEFIDRLAQLYVGGGHVYSATHTEAEFNADMDVEAYYIVADSAKEEKITFCPFSQVYESLSISNEWRKDVLGTIDTPIMQALNDFERISFASSDTWTLLDPVVVAIFIEPKVVAEIKHSKNEIILCEPHRGTTTNNFTSLSPNAQIFYSGSIDAYKNLLVDIYSAELINKSH